MESDRELLLLAAKAAGLPIWRIVDADEVADSPLQVFIHHPCVGVEEWNPLEDDGMALRLAVKLGLRVLTESLDAKPAVVSKDGRIHILGYKSSDACAQVRRCIVRAAASIAKDAEREEM